MIVEALGKQHDRAAFSCGKPVFDEYLKERARQDARRYVAAPFVLVAEPGAKTILGYYTLSAFAVELADLSPAMARKLPAYPNIPVTLLGRLAVDERHVGQGLGEFLLVDALHRSFTQSSQIGSVAVVVDAIDAEAVCFYEHFDFLPFPDRPGRLFLPMQTIAMLFA